MPIFLSFLNYLIALGTKKRRKRIKTRREPGMNARGQQARRKRVKIKRRIERESQRVTRMSKYALKICFVCLCSVLLNPRIPRAFKLVLHILLCVLSWQSRSQGIMMKKNKAMIVKKRKRRRRQQILLPQNIGSHQPKKGAEIQQGSPKSMGMIIMKRIWI